MSDCQKEKSPHRRQPVTDEKYIKSEPSYIYFSNIIPQTKPKCKGEF